MKASEIKQMSIEDLKSLLLNMKSEISKIKMNHKVSEIENPIQIRHKRRTIARIQTELRSRELQA